MLKVLLLVVTVICCAKADSFWSVQRPSIDICPEGASRCLARENECCPYPGDAVCCNNDYCCPKGTTCDEDMQSCNAGKGLFVPWKQKLPVKSTKLFFNLTTVNQNCPDKSSCPTDYTCCQMSRGGYGCCALPDATCCSDHIHCCPSGATCDVTHRRCVQQFEAKESLGSAVPLEPNSLCPDQRSSCPGQETCCLMQGGSYGCCPFAQGTCCSDHLHCCPSGTQCSAAGFCLRSDNVNVNDNFL